MNPDKPDTVQTEDPTRWQDTHMEDVFLPSVRVQLGWQDLEAAVQAGAVVPAQAHVLWAHWAAPGSSTRVVPPTALAQPLDGETEAGEPLPGAQAGLNGPGVRGAQPIGSPGVSFTNTLYYLGGMLAIGAMTLFMTLGWELLGAWGVLALALGYMVGALLVAGNLLQKGLRTPAGILATLAVCLVPLAVWALQKGLGAWPDMGADSYRDYHRYVDWRWITLELATLAAGVVMLWRYKLPFMVMPVAVTLWYMSMDVARFLMEANGFDWQFLLDVTLAFGLFTCAVAVWVDLRTRRATRPEDRQDFAFWLYLLGASMFWAGLTMQNSDSELNKFLYALINLGLVFLGAAIGRRVFTVLGALGLASYLGYLSYRVFQDSLMFPFALTLLGLAVVGLGIWWQKHEASLHARLASWLPAALQPLAQG